MIHALFPLVISLGKILLWSLAIYLGIRFFAYKRSFRLPRRYDLLWVLNTLLAMFLSAVSQPPFDGTLSPRGFLAMSFVAFLLSAYLLIFVVEQFIVEHLLVNVLKMYVSPPLRKVLVMGVFAIAVVVGVQKIFSINPWAVYAPTSLLSLGIGIALKDAFQTFFAGVALSSIIRIGDWIRVNEREGQVMAIDWARTVLRGNDGTYWFIPNSELQKGAFQSFSYSDRTLRMRLEIGAAYDVPPQKVKKVLLECVQNVKGVLASPAPDVLLTHYGDSAIQYMLVFSVSEYAVRGPACSEISTRIWYAFKRENIEIPYPIRTVQVIRKSRDESRPEPEALLSQIDLFKGLPQDVKQLILERLQRQTYLKDEIVVREGENGSSLYIVLKGRLEVVKHRKDGKNIFVVELKTGQFFGEMSLLTGEPRSATVRALADSELLRIEKHDFREVMEQHPDLAETLAGAMAARQAELAEHSKDKNENGPVHSKKSSLSRKIREFFNLREHV